ncbi:hypothetical protein [Paenibacillus humicus]|uniref:hypothetical protein n=1 Tax=Paenibacillus humicus TaxID=412861 RepID=UPI000FDC8491|nr:hypothetical protein [Paenibacillus humicus]
MKVPTVNISEETLTIEYSRFFVTEKTKNLSPIDTFYNECTELVKMTEPSMLNENPSLSRLLVLGFVSAVEKYLRSIFCEVIYLCPHAKKKSSEQKIKLGSIDYYGLKKAAEGIFEENSFASSKEIRSLSSSLLGFTINQGTSLDAALKEFNKVCHLRHCAVHGAGKLNAHNAKELGITDDLNEDEHKNLLADSNALQDALKICFSFVRAFNQALFENAIKSWVGNVIKGGWHSEKVIFGGLIQAFWSAVDNSSTPDLRKMYREIVPIIQPKDVYPEDERNYKILRTLIKSFIEGSSRDDRFFNDLERLSYFELISLFRTLQFYDHEELKYIFERIIEKAKKDHVQLAAIHIILSLGEDLQNQPTEAPQEPETEGIIKTIQVAYNNYGYKFEELFPFLSLLEISTVEIIINTLPLIGIELLFHELDKRGYKEIESVSQNLEVLDIEENDIQLAGYYMLNAKHMDDYMEDIEVVTNYVLRKNGSFELTAFETL